MITRFAPSMTGYLHLGHLFHLLNLYAISRLYKLSIKLRIEDHDLTRARSEYETALFSDLQAFGFEWFDAALYQSRSTSYYDDQLAYLYERGLVYGCACSRSQIMSTQIDHDKEICYKGTCEKKDLPLSGNTVRVRVAKDKVEFEDLLIGFQIQHPKTQCGDFPIRDRHGNYTYQFACVCDDIRQGVTHIIRGIDILPSTGRQIYLYRMMKEIIPKFIHHPLKTDKNGIKLSKRNRSESLSNQLNKGISPQSLFAEALGLSGSISLDEALDYLLKHKSIKSLSAQST